MKKQFYSHLVEVDELFVALESLDMHEKERRHLQTIVFSSIHTVVIDIVLSHIPSQDKQLFLDKIYNNEDHEKIWKFLHKRSINLEKKISHAIGILLKEFSQDIMKIGKENI